MKSLIHRRSNPPPLGEIPHNQQSQAPMTRAGGPDTGGGGSGSARSRSPTKSALGNLSLKAMAPKSRESSPSKHKKTRSATNLAGLLGKPKSLRNLYKLAAEGEAARGGSDLAKREPAGGGEGQPPTPIYAQFTSDVGRPMSVEIPPNVDKTGKQRPRSFHPHYLSASPSKEHIGPPPPSPKKTSSWDRPAKPPRPGILASLRSRSKSQDAVPVVSAAPDPAPAEAPIDPRDINGHLEAMLNRRNIPENQRYKMRNLNDTIKMEFIRQDWAEMAAKGEAPPEASGSSSAGGSEREKKRGRGRTFTLGKGSKGSSSSGKKVSQGTLGRHFRTRSSESIGSERTVSGRSTSPGSGILSKIKLGQGPGDFVAYLRRVTKPEVVEVGKLHKLRLLLRNETVSWTEEFIQLGGMKEIVELLYRIMEVEWR